METIPLVKQLTTRLRTNSLKLPSSIMPSLLVLI
jgi:hypothetical protein